MNQVFQNVNLEQNSYRASEFENAFDELSILYYQLLNGNSDNVNYAIELINKYQLNRDIAGFDTDFDTSEQLDYDSFGKKND